MLDFNTTFLKVQNADVSKYVNVNNIAELVPNENGTFDVYGEKKYSDCEWGNKEYIGETTKNQNIINLCLNMIG